MKRIKKYIANKWLIFLMNMVCIAVIFWLTSSDFDFVDYINIFFYFTMLYIVLWLFLLILKGGFFDGIVFSFRKYHAYTSKKRDYLGSIEKKADPSDRLPHLFYRQIRFHSLLLFVLFLVLMVVYAV